MIRRGLTLRFKIDCLGLHKSLLSLCTLHMTELLLHLILYKYHYLFLKLVIYLNNRRRSTPECHFTASYVLCKWQKQTILFIESWILKEKSLRSARQVKEKWKTVCFFLANLPVICHYRHCYTKQTDIYWSEIIMELRYPKEIKLSRKVEF